MEKKMNNENEKERRERQYREDKRESDLRSSYRFQKEQFRDQKRRILWQIENLRRGEEDIENQIQISRLERQIQTIRPKTPKGTQVCPKCDCTSMEYKRRSYSWLLRRESMIYRCEICGRTEKY